MQIFKLVIAVLGRICLSAIFVIAGLNKILNWEASKEALLEVIGKWHTYSNVVFFEKILNMISDRAEIFLWMATVCELLGGILVLIGIFCRVGSFLLILFLIPTTILFHAFWFMQSPEKDIQVVMFMKNLAVFGGLMMVLAFGSGFSRSSSTIKDSL